MVFITGDTHGSFAERFSVTNFAEQKQMTRDDIVIVCGDFGIWTDNAQERYWLDWLAGKSFTLCFCDGNHENFDRLYGDEFLTVDFHGGKAQKIRDNIYHLLRGEIYDFGGSKFFVMGGAKSHDIQDGVLDPDDYKAFSEFKRVYKHMALQRKMFRVNHVSWWKEEMPSEDEYTKASAILEENGNKVDYIISHCAPTSIVYELGYDEHDELTDFLQCVKRTCEFKRWFFGHYHQDTDIDDKFTLLYHRILKLEDGDDYKENV